MAYNTYYPGALVTVQAVFGTVASPSVPADPSGAITLQYEGPDQSLITIPQASLTKTATGTWQYQIDTTGLSSGVWFYRFFSAPGNGQAAMENRFILNDSFAR